MAPSLAAPVTNLEKFVKSLRGQSLEASIESLISLLKRRQINGPEQCAIATAHILRHVVAKAKWTDVDSLLDRVQRVGRRLVAARPQEYVIGNVVRRVLGLIRDEAESDRNGDELEDSISDLSTHQLSNNHTSGLGESFDAPTPALSTAGSLGMPPRPAPRPPVLSSAGSFYVPQSMFNLLSEFSAAESPSSGPGSPLDRDSGVMTSSLATSLGFNPDISALKSELINGIDEIKDEISQVDDQIASFAEVQIHPGECVLVYKPNNTVQRFLIGAAKRKRFTVMFVGDGPAAAKETSRTALRKKLTNSGVQCITIRGSGLMAYMPRVHKVIIGARSIMADGGVIAEGGTGLVTRAAREYGTSVFVLGGVYKLCPEEQPDLNAMIEIGCPADEVSFADGPLVDGVDVQSPLTDFIPPVQVDIYITDLGPHSRDHLQSIITDHYKKEDVDFTIG